MSKSKAQMPNQIQSSNIKIPHVLNLDFELDLKFGF